MNRFPELKSQEEINSEGKTDWMCIYVKITAIMSIMLYVLMIVGLIKWIFFS